MSQRKLYTSILNPLRTRQRLALLVVFVIFVTYQFIKFWFGDAIDNVISSVYNGLCSGGCHCSPRSTKHEPPPRPPFSQTYRVKLTPKQLSKVKTTGTLRHSELRLGMRFHEEDSTATIDWLSDGEDKFGVKHTKGDPKYTWEVIRDTGLP